MSYQLETNEKLPYGIKRIAYEQVDELLVLLQTSDDDLDEAVHESRKYLKKLRGLLRLVRMEVGEPVFQQENIAYRDAGRCISDLRDSAVLIHTLQQLSLDYDISMAADDPFLTLQESLVDFYQTTRHQVVVEEQALLKSAEAVSLARQRISRWPLEDDSFTAVRGGLHKIYKQGRKQLREVSMNPDDEALHEWRKRAKDLWYSVCILQSIWLGPMSALAEEIHVLTELLGEDHDLAQLQQFVNERPSALEDAEEREALTALIARKRAMLQPQALQLGRSVYAESPTAFVKRMETYWEVAQSKR